MNEQGAAARFFTHATAPWIILNKRRALRSYTYSPMPVFFYISAFVVAFVAPAVPAAISAAAAVAAAFAAIPVVISSAAVRVICLDAGRVYRFFIV